jgi:hypothetical protein
MVLLAVLPARAGDYWVKNGGNDAADGLSVATAWATPSHAASVAEGGDTVHVLDGSYAGFYQSASGTAGNPITYHAEGANVRITADNGTTPDGINIENADWVVIDGFIVDNRTRAGIRTALSHFVTIRNCHTGYNGHWGIFSGFADDLTIENNEAHHSVVEHGIYVSNSGDRPIIRGNLVHDNNANGIHMNGDLSQGGDGLISNALVERNTIYGNGAAGGSGINMDGVTNSIVQDNLLYDNHASGISLYQIDGATGSTGNLVVNNTIVEASDARWCVNINTGSTGNTVLNNILYNYHSFHGVIAIDASSRAGFTSDYNTVMDRFSIDGGDTVIGLAAWQALGYDAHSVIATPAQLFLNPGTDFRLLDPGPAIDAGTATDAPNHDLDGNPRPVGAGFDIGAYEAQLVSCNNGMADPGEQCGDPGTAGCSDPCTSCAQCVCVQNTPVCGDGLLCGAEECEVDGNCGAGETCQACRCTNASACTSGIVIEKPSQSLRADPFSLHLKGQAVIPKPWTGVDPPANGVRLVIDGLTGPGGLDVTIPGGAAWRTNGSATTWSYKDPSGAVGGITGVVVKDLSRKEDGLLHWTVKGKNAAAVMLPDVARVRTAMILGTPAECATLAWNAPGGASPRCEGDATRLSCR